VSTGSVVCGSWATNQGNTGSFLFIFLFFKVSNGQTSEFNHGVTLRNFRQGRQANRCSLR